MKKLNTIKLNEKNHKKLMEIKYSNGFKSVDEIMTLLLNDKNYLNKLKNKK